MTKHLPRSAWNTVILHSALLLVPLRLAADPIQIAPDGSQLELALPDSTTPGKFRMMERSSDLIHWEPVARDYGNTWETIFPRALPVTSGNSNQSLTDAIDAPKRFYRMASEAVVTLSNEDAASRFLQQATFGPTRAMIANFPGIDAPAGFNDAPYTYFQQWLDAEMAKPVTSLRAFWRQRSNPTFVAGTDPYEVAHNPAYGHQFPYYSGTVLNQTAGKEISANHAKEAVWHHAAITADDALRQRAAWALGQIFVIGTSGMSQTDTGEAWLNYYDIFVRNAFGNFRDILDEVTYSPMMGLYLTYQGNQKANAAGTTFPDENYAREIMQLFTIGLWLLNQDGTAVTDSLGNQVPTYDNDDIFEFAKIFTGLRLATTRGNIEINSSNRVDPMRVNTPVHDYTAKTLLDYDGPDGPLTAPTLGPFTNDEAGLRADIAGILDHLFNHPNVPPFISRLLIQRMTVSNPSPGYISAVAGAFINGSYQGVGSGIRGDMAAVFRAILLHPEAREPGLAADAAHGSLREPLVRLMNYARAFQLTPDPAPANNPFGILAFKDIDDETAQAPFASPSVFNFYLPDFQPNGEILDRDLYSPEFQIHNDVTALTLQNAIRELVYSGIDSTLGATKLQADLDLSHEMALAEDSPAGRDALVDHLELMLAPGRLSAENRTAIITAISTTTGNTDAQRLARARLALWLFGLLPEFNVIH